ncbi:MAG: rod-binding protein [Selenomonas sp.]|nr:rod-binding protein [Selenomonas sp.]
MQITPLGINSNTELMGNNTYESARTAAESAKFADVLKDLQNKAAVKPEDTEVAKRDKDLRKACEGFEAMFLSMMYRQMRATVPKNELFGESNALKIFQDMRDDELMKNVAAGGGIGIADMMYKQLKPQVEKQSQNVIK